MQNYVFFQHPQVPESLFKLCMPNINQPKTLIINTLTKKQTLAIFMQTLS